MKRTVSNKLRLSISTLRRLDPERLAGMHGGRFTDKKTDICITEWGDGCQPSWKATCTCPVVTNGNCSQVC